MAWGCLTTSALRAPWILDATESLNQPRCRPHVRSDEPPSMRATGKRESHRNAARIAGHDQLRTVKLDQSPSDCKLRPRKVSSDRSRVLADSRVELEPDVLSVGKNA